MAMSPRLLRPIASGVHPDAAAWRSAVVANGGSVSGSTLNEVSKFCRAIDAAGIRDRFYRLNLFVGDGLNAALVPLYRGPTYGGTTYGNTTDTNNGPFVSGDYAEATGLLGASGKFLDTGLPANFVASRHMAWACQSLSATGNKRPMGMAPDGAGSTNQFSMTGTGAAGFLLQTADGSTFTSTGAITAAAGSVVIASVVGTTATMYHNGVANATTCVSTAPTSTWLLPVMALRNSVSTTTLNYDGRVSGYSYGEGMTASQALAYSNALRSFNASLGRAS